MNSIWKGPRAAAFIAEMAHALINGKNHCVLFLPERFHKEFLSAFRKYVENSQYFIYTAATKKDCGLAECLAPIFCVDEQNELELSNIASRPVRDDAMPVLACPQDSCRAFTETIHLAEILKEKAAGEVDGDTPDCRWQMLFVTTPGAPFPEGGTRFRHFYWWGRLMQSDLQFVIEEEFGDKKLSRSVWLWFYSLCLGLGANALELVPILARFSKDKIATIMKILGNHPLANKKNAELARNLLKNRSIPQFRSELPGKLALSAWQAGIIDIGCNNQPEIHPAVLYAAGRMDILNEKLLAAQIQVYFPLVHEVCEFMRKRLASNAKVCAKAPELLGNAEIGPFQHFFNTHADIANSMPQEKELVYLWWKLRNNLAHHTLVDSDHAMKCVLLLDRLKNSLLAENPA